MANRENEELLLITGTAATTATTSSDQVNKSKRGLLIEVDITDIHTVTPGLTITIQGKIGANYHTLLASSALTAVGKTYLWVHPTVTAAANAKINLPLPRVWRIDVAVADADACTYTVRAQVLD